ncbi:MAG TPA: matrixin family metalloprotease [Polyangiaceae bacterium]|nr:matrixin family metalloprotease [Polyangiaceae bacterium]
MRPRPKAQSASLFAATCFGVIALIAPPARAFCRAFTEGPPQGYDPTQGCFAPTAPEAKLVFWRGTCTAYTLQQDTPADISFEKADAAIARAFKAWSDVECPGGGHPSIGVENLGPVACSLVEYNNPQPNQNVFVFRGDGWPHRDPANPLGLTTLHFEKTTGEIYDADVELNASDFILVTDGTATPGTYQLDTVITHEVGHFLGLAHATVATSLMWANYQPGAATIAQDDIEGICAIYPPNGTRSTTDGVVAKSACDPKPRHGFSSQCGSTMPAVTPPAEEPAKGGCSMASASPPAAPSPWAMPYALLATGALLRRNRRPAKAARAAPKRSTS